MNEHWTYALLSVLIVSLLSLLGITVLLISQDRLRRTLRVLVALAAGALFGDAFLHLLPEAFAKSRGTTGVSFCVLAGIFAFFVLEKILRWQHRHFPSPRPIGYLNLVADAVHNFVDGVLIAASYLVSVPLGVSTATAVILHEIPQEIGDFGILLHAGFTKRQALLFNFASACLAIVGTLITLAIGSRVNAIAELMVPVTAGGFIYIAGSDLVPELQVEADPRASVLQMFWMIAGAGLMAFLAV